MWVYINSEPGLWTVGFYSPDGKWHPDSDYDNVQEAATRCNYLNGGKTPANNGPKPDAVRRAAHPTKLKIGPGRECTCGAEIKRMVFGIPLRHAFDCPLHDPHGLRMR